MTVTQRVNPTSEFVAAGGKEGDLPLSFWGHCQSCDRPGPVALSEGAALLDALRAGWTIKPLKKPKLLHFTKLTLPATHDLFCPACARHDLKSEASRL
jgi:hypothetical protein